MNAAPLLDDRGLLVRADASKDIGTGHLMRMLALAQAWIDSGGRARWLLAEAPDALVARIEAESIPIDRVRGPAGATQDGAQLRDALAQDPSAVAVLDGESFDGEYLVTLGAAGGRALVVDDIARRSAYPVGFVLNQNADAERTDYPPDATCRFLLGARYALLRREFRHIEVRGPTPPRARHLLVSFGGADPTDLTRRTIEALRRLPAAARRDIDVRVVVGAANAEADAIEQQVAAPDLGFRSRVERAVTDMAAPIAWADLAIVSGGSTVWEMARMGCPAIIVETVPSEERLVSGLGKVGLFGHLGRASDIDETAMTTEIAARIRDQAWRDHMSARGRRLVDGKGALRVAGALAGENARDDAHGFD
jgi:UDP-2,4-diacetamido-2,4,6-trideoxy-beta-L-altropyranose hydrolase